ncbi:DUF6545 domain-containing protein [Micromonospora sp. NPDC048930]|uniref:DUF6545 domain-containing protein n=1 Tax=Micromonospora sp. NPDC048930 TaxID=3364261 RepID=UPI00370FA4EF
MFGPALIAYQEVWMLLARARLSRRLREANVPPPPAPYTVDAWCEAIGRARGRDLRVHDVRLGADLPPGLLVRRAHVDRILVDEALPALARAQTVLHEVAHVVLEHDGDVLHDDVDPAVEAEAELAADLLYRQLTRAASATAAAHAAMDVSRMRLPGAMPAWWADRRHDWDLLQLWMTLREGMPDVALVSTSTAAPVPVEIRGSRQRYRTVIEIHEALRVLRPWCSRQVYASAARRARRHRLDAAAVAAVAEAATVAVALRRRHTSLPPGADDSPLLSERHDPHDVRAEARRLARMARALHESPLVAAEIARRVPVVAAVAAEDAMSDPTPVGGTPVISLAATPRDRSPSAV